MDTAPAKPLLFNDLYKGSSSKPLMFNDLYKAPSPKPLMFNDLWPPPRPLLFNDLYPPRSGTDHRGSDDPLHKRVWDESQHRRNEKGQFTAFMTRAAEAAWNDPARTLDWLLGGSAVAARARKDPLNLSDPWATEPVTLAGIMAALQDGQRNARTNPVNAATGATQVADASAAIALGGETELFAELLALATSPLAVSIMAGLMMLVPTPVADGTCASGECTTPVENQPSILYSKKGGEKPKRKTVSGSGQEKATDVPSWAKGERPYVGESGKEFAKRLLDKQFGEIEHATGTNSDFNKIKKWGDRAFK